MFFGPDIDSCREYLVKNCDTNSQGGCWTWRAYTNPNGYGQFRRGGQSYLAHRAAYCLFNGPVIDGINVLHKCDNPPCCNPEHLFLGTQKENMQDCARKGRLFYKWAKLTPDNVRAIRSYKFQHGDVGRLARQLGISRHQVTRIRKGMHWTNVTQLEKPT